MKKTIFGYSYQKLEKGGILFQKGGVRNRTMSSGYKGVSKPKDIKPESGAKRTLYTEKIADTNNSAYGAKSGDMNYQDMQRAKQQELVQKYGMLDDDTLIKMYQPTKDGSGNVIPGQIDKETGQLLSDAYNRDLALKNNQVNYKRKFNSAIGLNPELEYLAANKMSFNTPDPIQIDKTKQKPSGLTNKAQIIVNDVYTKTQQSPSGQSQGRVIVNVNLDENGNITKALGTGKQNGQAANLSISSLSVDYSDAYDHRDIKTPVLHDKVLNSPEVQSAIRDWVSKTKAANQKSISENQMRQK